MPFKDPEQKKRWSKQWRKDSIANGYGKWLYQRRALRYADADYFKEALEEIVNGAVDPEQVALDALFSSKERWAELPPSPGAGKRGPAKPDDDLVSAVKRSGLE